MNNLDANFWRGSRNLQDITGSQSGIVNTRFTMRDLTNGKDNWDLDEIFYLTDEFFLGPSYHSGPDWDSAGVNIGYKGQLSGIPLIGELFESGNFNVKHTEYLNGERTTTLGISIDF